MIGREKRRSGSRKPAPANECDEHGTKKRLPLLYHSRRWESLPSVNRCMLLLLACIMTDHFVMLAVAAAASTPVVVVDSTTGFRMNNALPRPKLFWSVPLIPWVGAWEITPMQCEDRYQLPFVNKSRYKKQRLSALIKDSLSGQSLFGFYPKSNKSTLKPVITIRGGEVGDNNDEESDNDLNNLELSDIDDEIPAEDLLDAIFDSNEPLHPPTMAPKPSKMVQKKRDSSEPQQRKQQVEGSQNGKLQESVEKKANVTGDSKLLDDSSNQDEDYIIDFDKIFDKSASRDEQKGAANDAKARASSKQNMSTAVDNESGTRLERVSARKTADAFSLADLRSDRFLEEFDRLSSPLPLSQRELNRVDKKTAMPRRKTIDATPEAPRKRVQEIRAAPTISTSGVTMKGTSPAFVRRGASTPSSKNVELKSPSASSRAHAVWGPHAQHLKTNPGPPNGPSRYKATEDERRAHETRSRIREERKKLLSNLAINMNDSHTSIVKALIRGSAAHIPPELFGQTIMQEKSACNEKFYGSVTEVKSSLDEAGASPGLDSTVLGEEVDVATPSFRHIEDPTLLSYWGLTPHAKLYGGAQYHRVLRYYHHMFLTVPLPPITDDEVALLTNGITEVHDASDLMRAVALLVRSKMEVVMEDVLADMTRRLLYVFERLWEMVEYSMALHRPVRGANGLGKSVLSEAGLLNRHGIEYSTAESSLKDVLSTGFRNFSREKAAMAHRQSVEDIRSLLRYVTWDMGRARKRAPNQGRNSQGFVSQIEIVGRDSINNGESDPGQSGHQQYKKTPKNVKKKNGRSRTTAGSSERIMARGGGAAGSGKKRSRRWSEKEGSHSQGLEKDDEDMPGQHRGREQELEDDMGDLVGGVLNRGKPDSDKADNVRNNQSVIISSQTSPLFSGDDEVLSVLLATVSSTLAPKSDIQAGHTQAAIENLVSYVTDRMRMDMSRIVRAKFNSFFLLAFYEDLGPYLSRKLDEYLNSVE